MAGHSRSHSLPRHMAVLAGAALLSACAGGEERTPAPVTFQGTQPSGTEGAATPGPAGSASTPAPATPTGPDPRGVIFNDGYETIQARSGDTVDSMAARVGITGAELAAYNGLPTTYQPRAGDELVLPARPDGYRSAPSNAPATATGASTTASAEAAAAVPAPTPIETTAIGAEQPAAPEAQTGSGWSASSIAAAIEASDQPSATEDPATLQTAPAASDPGGLTAAPSPVPADAPATEPVTAPITAPAPAPAPSATPAPEAMPEPALEETELAAAQSPEAAQPAGAVTPTAAETTRFARPVDAPISRRFSRLPGPNRNDGVDFASPAGMTVRAAESGTVALVSKSLGGLGTIVLIRHEGGLLTVYGRVDDVTVTKGDTVQRGQAFARVAALAAPREPSLHFEVRQGAESVDPADFI